MHLQKKMAVGAVWLMSLKMLERGLGVISTVVLARLLTPDDFGVVAIAMSILALLDIFGAFGFDTAIIQNPNADDSHYHSAWTWNLCFAAAVSVLFVVLAPLAARYFNEPRLIYVMYAVAGNYLIAAFENIGMVKYRKELNFRFEFMTLLSKKLVSVLATILMAWYFRNYIALLGGVFISRVFGVFLSYLLHPFRPKLSLQRAAELFGFSKWLLFNNILLFVNQRGSDFFLAKLLGAPVLGTYSVVNDFASMPTVEAAAAVSRASMPGYAKLKHDSAALSVAYLKNLSMLVTVVAPAAFGISATAMLVVPVVLGSQWTHAVPLLQVLPFASLLYAILNSCAVIHLSLGRPRITTLVTSIQALALMLMVYPATTRFGVMGLAWGMIGVVGVTMLMNFGFVTRSLSMRWTDLLRAVYRPMLASALMFIVLLQLQNLAGFAAVAVVGVAAQLMLAIGLGAGIYVLALMLFWKLAGCPEGMEHAAWAKLNSVLRKP